MDLLLAESSTRGLLVSSFDRVLDDVGGECGGVVRTDMIDSRGLGDGVKGVEALDWWPVRLRVPLSQEGNGVVDAHGAGLEASAALKPCAGVHLCVCFWGQDLRNLGFLRRCYGLILLELDVLVMLVGRRAN